MPTPSVAPAQDAGRALTTAATTSVGWLMFTLVTKEQLLASETVTKCVPAGKPVRVTVPAVPADQA